MEIEDGCGPVKVVPPEKEWGESDWQKWYEKIAGIVVNACAREENERGEEGK